MRSSNTIEHFIKFAVHKHAYLESKDTHCYAWGVLVSGKSVVELIEKGNDIYVMQQQHGLPFLLTT